MSPTSGQANDTPLNAQRPNYGSLTHPNQPVAVRTRAGPKANAPSPALSLKPRQRQQDGTGTGTGTGVGAGIATAGARNTATLHRSVQLTVPDQDEHGSAHANNDQDGNDTSSISSRSSYSTYSSSTGSLQALDHHNHKGHSHGEGDEPGEEEEEEEEEASSRRMFWTYVSLTPVLLSILVLFAVLLQFLPSSIESGEYIVHWDRFGEGVIGWTISFAARTPLFAFFSKTFSQSHNLQEDLYLSEWSTLLSAGALEETLRLVIILFLGIREDFGSVYWLGLGWAGIETVYYIGQSLVYTRWLASSDEDYRTITTGIGNGVAATTSMVVAPTVTTSLLASANASAGGPSTSTSTSETPSSLESGYTNGRKGVTNHTQILHTDIEEAEDLVPTREAQHLLGLDRPWWSLMGRTSNMMVHIGLCCWLGHSGWRLLLPAAAVHGSLYVIWGVFMPSEWSVPATSYGTWIAALGVFLIGLALYGEIV